MQGTAAAGDQQATVLCVGLNDVDLITVVERYPEEDSDQRGIEYRRQRGGNASNTSTVLSHLHNCCEFLGVLPSCSSPEYSWLLEDFRRCGIITAGCVQSDVPLPMATVLVSRQTGSRTIVYCDNGFPELSHKQFVDSVMDRLHQYRWIHFELRPKVDDVLRMLETANSQRAAMTSDVRHGAKATRGQGSYVISVEIEKPECDRPERVMTLADVVFISKDWARSRGWTDMRSAVISARSLCRPGQVTVVVSPWAEEGAAACQNDDVIVVPACAPGDVVDTLGAGDTFVAGFIHARMRSSDLKLALTYACHLAGVKCTLAGYDGLRECADWQKFEAKT
ncbi:hypothetical protein BaRGS_00022761 [Batillaria attramentaria]|uniref:Carbohydrate kinase PfkB domain-containing protein n=1 Tax=Batillaria attramentaria TaxID=370345 RepID=A0ABD0KFY2_9CAEN